MDDLILFRFHKDIDHCVKNLDILQTLNPDTPIYGVGEKIDGYERLTNSYLEDIHVVTNKTDRWKWLNGDFVIVDWFENVGHKLDFDRCYVVEWDMLYTEPMESVYSHIDKDQIGMTGVSLSGRWSWMSGRTKQIEYISDLCSDYYNKSRPDIRFGLLPGAVLTRNFIEEYIGLCPPVGSDEIRLSVVSSYSNYNVIDTQLMSDTDDGLFNTKNNQLNKEEIEEGLRNRKEVFHPVRKTELYDIILKTPI